VALFGAKQRIPQPVRSVLEQNGILLLEEDLGGSVTYRDFRAPGRYSSYKLQPMSWALALSSRGLLLWHGRSPFIDIAWTEPRIAALHARVDEKGQLAITWDASTFQPSWSGSIEVHVRCADAAAVLALLRSHAPGMPIG
jgi:hypothetical protein